MAIFSDNFEAYPLGYQIGLGGHGSPWDLFPATNATTVPGSPDGVGSQSCQLGQLQYTTPLFAAAPNQSCTMNIYMNSTSSNSPGLQLMECVGYTPSGTMGTQIATFGLNPNGTLFCTVMSNQYVGSTTIPIFFNTWYTVTMNLEISTYLVGMAQFVSIQVNAAIDGIQQINQLMLTGVGVAPQLTGISQWIFNGPGHNGGIVDNIIVSPFGGTITPPVSSQPAKIFQAAIEPIRGGTPSALIYQGVVELLVGKPPTVQASCVMNG